MNYHFILIFFLAIIGIDSSLIAQNNPTLTTLDVCLNPKLLTQPTEEQDIHWTEDESARTLNTSTYSSDDGQRKTRQSSRPINYMNQYGFLVPIQSALVDFGNGHYQATDQPFPTYFHTDGRMMLTLPQNNLLTFGGKCSINGALINAKYSLENNVAITKNIIPGVDKEIRFRENGVKYNYIMTQAMQNITESVVFSEEIELPDGYTITKDESRGEKTQYGWSGLLVVKDQSGNVVSTFHEPLCFDQARKYMVASYVVKIEKGKHILEIVVPSDWLNASERQYPVVIDPIVTGPTAAWVGGAMPSCWMPSYNQDSILVTIPADITITELNVTASFYADPFSGAWMEDGAMFFSTDCANTSTFTITGIPGQVAGTAYLDYFNLYNPLTCCYPKSCVAQTFWLSFHLGRNSLGSGCNTTYIRYDPATTSWPFEAVVVGKTAEHTGAEWNVPPIPTCSNDCDITAIAYVSFGVPPFTFTHPWTSEVFIGGTNVGCTTGSTTHLFHLTPPNCPNYCDTINTTLSVPPPIIIDACGNQIALASPGSVPIKPTPSFNPVYDTLVCSGTPFVIDLNLCMPLSTMQWNGNGVTGWDDQIPQTLVNTGQNTTMINYTAFAIMNGCFSDTIDIPMYVQPNPVAAYNANPSPMIIGVPIDFTDASVFSASPGVFWLYTYGDGQGEPSQNATHMYPNPGEYEICLFVEDQRGCVDTICSIVPVAPAEVSIPNIITANGDGVNDLLEFQFLEYYPDNHLTIIDRWGLVLYETDNYQNDWDPRFYSDGTYFFRLTLTAAGKEYNGFFQLVK